MVKRFSKISTLFSPVLLFVLTELGFVNIMIAAEDYREYVSFHVGRRTYIAGEQIFYKAYCYTQNKKDIFLSKPLYIELIDRNKKSILTQVLRVESNVASSIIQLPDTLSTGIYYLKGYTQWMRNFGEQSFASLPVYIYNQYNEESFKSLSAYDMPFEPEIYIRGNKLIDGLPVQIKIVVPGLFGNTLKISLQESVSQKTIRRVATNAEGEAEFFFTPVRGEKYHLVAGDSIHGEVSCKLPPVENSGYSLSARLSETGKLLVTVNGKNIQPGQLRLNLISGSTTLWEKAVHSEYFNEELNIQFSPDPGYYTFRLTDNSENILVEQSIGILPGTNVIRADSMYTTRQQMNVKFDFSSLLFQKNTSFSVSIHKILPVQNDATVNDNLIPDKVVNYIPDREFVVVLPRYYPESLPSGYHYAEFPAEDMGILYTGRVINSFGSSAPKSFEIRLAFMDTTGIILAAKTDPTGHFSMLLNEYGNKEAYLFLFLDGISLNGDQNIEIDKKYYYQTALIKQPNRLNLENNLLFTGEMQDEAQRVLIQRAFRNNEIRSDRNGTCMGVITERFYGNPEIVVYTGDYIFLPNFEEIAREILPRIRYKHSKDKCELTIFHIEDNIRSDNPIVLVDGIYISDFRELYQLNSDDIQRIEIQSGLRVSGQLLYNGLLAIYTTKKYKAEKAKSNGRSIYSIPGYVNNTMEYSREAVEPVEHSTAPDFANQLYWNPTLLPDENGMAEISFLTSDEEGEYVIDVVGHTPNDMPVKFSKRFKVSANK